MRSKPESADGNVVLKGQQCALRNAEASNADEAALMQTRLNLNRDASPDGVREKIKAVARNHWDLLKSLAGQSYLLDPCHPKPNQRS